MSYLPCADPERLSNDCSEVELVILPRTSDLGNFTVHRALPFRERRMVGPFIFWDQMGPGEFLTGEGIDVLPHPHIGLSTVTYLLSGTLDHKDSLGTDMRINAGDVNLMSAGKGIVHSERTGMDVRRTPSDLFGIQSWLAQPKSSESSMPSFHHSSVASLPTFDEDGVAGRVVLGSYRGLDSPVPTEWNTLYVSIDMESGSITSFPALTEERAIFILSGSIEISRDTFPAGQMIVLKPGRDMDIKALTDTRAMLLGGAVMDGPRYIDWNFVASDREIIAEAKRNWIAQRFPKVPGDEDEFVPLPDRLRPS